MWYIILPEVMFMEGCFRLITPEGARGVLRFGIRRMPKERQENTKAKSTV